MEAGEDTKYSQLFDAIDRRKQKIGEAAAQFPKTKEEYLEKSVDERLGLAMVILKTYAEIGQHSPGPVAANIVPDDRPDMVLTGAVGYVPEETFQRYKHIPRRDYEYINVGVGAKDPATGIITNGNERRHLGKIRAGSYIDGAGTRQEGWVVLLNDSEGTMLPVSSELGEELIEFVDAGVVGLIEGKISEHRKFLGDTALVGATEAIVDKDSTTTR
jgi:hypothetical protein